MPSPMRAQLAQMEANALKWKAVHPGAELFFRFPEAADFPDAPKDALVVGSIDETIRAGVMKANKNAVEFFQAMWPWDRPDTPTLSMVRYVLWKVFGDETTPPNLNR